VLSGDTQTIDFRRVMRRLIKGETMSGAELARVQNLRGLLEQAAPKLAAVAPKHLSAERVIRLMLAAMSRNPKLAECTKESVLSFCMKCSETGLEPIGAGGMWPVPYRNKNGTTEMQAIPDYRGLIHAAKMAGCIKDAYAEVVRANDEFDCEMGLNYSLSHKPARGDRGALESAYCIVVMPDGSKRFTVMDKADIDGIKARVRSVESGPWASDESEMWRKTVVRRAMKQFIGASQELNAAIELDNKASGVQLTPDPIAKPKAKAKEQPPADAAEPSDTIDPLDDLPPA